ncbi:hypothetical protein P9139_20395 [Curtobacterium flaccumfaciens]|nr:hypothetical protein P9139_20395 [Curtobacterium flaccumfaciens]
MSGVSTRSVRARADVRHDGELPVQRPDAPNPWVVALAPVPVLVAALAVRPLVQGTAWWVSGVLVAASLVGTMLVVRRRAPGIRFVALVAALVVCSCAAAVLNDVQPLGWLDRDGALGETLAAIRLNPAPLPQTDAIRLIVTVAIGWVAGASLFLAAVVPTAALAAAPALVILIVPVSSPGHRRRPGSSSSRRPRSSRCSGCPSGPCNARCRRPSSVRSGSWWPWVCRRSSRSTPAGCPGHRRDPVARATRTTGHAAQPRSGPPAAERARGVPVPLLRRAAGVPQARGPRRVRHG